jgi:hypothetical protein
MASRIAMNAEISATATNANAPSTSVKIRFIAESNSTCGASIISP